MMKPFVPLAMVLATLLTAACAGEGKMPRSTARATHYSQTTGAMPGTTPVRQFDDYEWLTPNPNYNPANARAAAADAERYRRRAQGAN